MLGSFLTRRWKIRRSRSRCWWNMAVTAATLRRQWRKRCSRNLSNCKNKAPTSSRAKSTERAVQIDRRLISHFDWPLLFFSLLFVAVGVMTIYSANYDMAAGHAGPLPARQVTWLGLGLIAMFTALSFDYHYIDRLAYPFYGSMLFLLALVLVIDRKSTRLNSSH